MSVAEPCTPPGRPLQTVTSSSPFAAGYEVEEPCDPGPGIVTDHHIFLSNSEERRTIFQAEDLPESMQRTLWRMSDFDVTKALYKSANSQVLLAIDRRSGAEMVLKLYVKARLVTLTRYQVAREIRIHSTLSHPSIVQLIAAFENRDHVVLALEWASGGDLYSALHRAGGVMPEERAVTRIIEPFLQVTGYLHSKNIIHRDIKPENIFLSESGDIKLGDFGLSVDCSLERPVTRGGTLDYMAPEVLLCHNKARPEDYKDKTQLVYSPKVDVWAIGVLAYELTTGRTPFSNDGAQEAGTGSSMYQRLQFPPGLSPQARSFMQAALCRSARKRPSVGELLQHPWILEHAAPPPPPARTSPTPSPLCLYERYSCPVTSPSSTSYDAASRMRHPEPGEGGVGTNSPALTTPAAAFERASDVHATSPTSAAPQFTAVSARSSPALRLLDHIQELPPPVKTKRAEGDSAATAAAASHLREAFEEQQPASPSAVCLGETPRELRGRLVQRLQPFLASLDCGGGGGGGSAGSSPSRRALMQLPHHHHHHLHHEPSPLHGTLSLPPPVRVSGSGPQPGAAAAAHQQQQQQGSCSGSPRVGVGAAWGSPIPTCPASPAQAPLPPRPSNLMHLVPAWEGSRVLALPPLQVQISTQPARTSPTSSTPVATAVAPTSSSSVASPLAATPMSPPPFFFAPSAAPRSGGAVAAGGGTASPVSPWSAAGDALSPSPSSALSCTAAGSVHRTSRLHSGESGCTPAAAVAAFAPLPPHLSSGSATASPHKLRMPATVSSPLPKPPLPPSSLSSTPSFSARAAAAAPGSPSSSPRASPSPSAMPNPFAVPSAQAGMPSASRLAGLLPNLMSLGERLKGVVSRKDSAGGDSLRPTTAAAVATTARA